MNYNKEILELMNQFESGYKEKDQNNLESFMQSVFSSENEISAVGTSAITTESEEWCQGRNAVKKLISDDWKYWGDLTLNTEQLYVDLDEKTGFIAINGSVFEKMHADSYYSYRLSLVNELANRNDMDNKTKLLEMMNGISNTMMETNKGDDYTWPVRITGFIVKENNHWRFKHIHFSYPVVFYPPVRNT